jgi:hypothetical protein
MYLRNLHDIGYLHVIDWYLYQATKAIKASTSPRSGFLTPSYDFDIETEQREGWTYAE